MEYYYLGTENLWCGNWNHLVCRRSKCEVDHPSQSTVVNLGRNQNWCSLWCPWSQVQQDISGQDNVRILGCLWTKHHRCTCKWNEFHLLCIVGLFLQWVCANIMYKLFAQTHCHFKPTLHKGWNSFYIFTLLICVWISFYQLQSLKWLCFYWKCKGMLSRWKIQEQDKSSDIEQQPSFVDRKISNIQPPNRGDYKTSTASYNFDKVWSGAPDGRFGK